MPTVAIMFILIFMFLLIGTPVGISLLFPLFIIILFDPVTTNGFLANVLYSGIHSFTLMAIPFFIVAGSLMDVGGLSKRLVNVAQRMIGRVTGSLGAVTVIACMFFGAVCGSAPATCAAIGAIMLPSMVRSGYNKYYATALVACSGGLGVIVPPSYPMVIYGTTNNVSIGELFIGGIGPAILVGSVLISINYFYCRKHKIKGTDPFSWKALFEALWDAKWALFMPVIILGGIYSGAFTATEASVVATVYSVIVGIFIYKELKWSKVVESFYTTAVFVGGTLLTMAPASALGKMFAVLGVTDGINALFLSLSDNRYVVLTALYIVLFFAGMFIETTPVVVILTPLLLPVATAVGLTPVQFGLVVVLALSIAFVTPPVACNLFVTSSMTGLPIERISKASIPFLIGLFFCLVMVGFFPQITDSFIILFGGR